MRDRRTTDVDGTLCEKMRSDAPAQCAEGLLLRVPAGIGPEEAFWTMRNLAARIFLTEVPRISGRAPRNTLRVFGDYELN
jgi:hypothetical protein